MFLCRHGVFRLLHQLKTDAYCQGAKQNHEAKCVLLWPLAHLRDRAILRYLIPDTASVESRQGSSSAMKRNQSAADLVAMRTTLLVPKTVTCRIFGAIRRGSQRFWGLQAARTLTLFVLQNIRQQSAKVVKVVRR